METGDRDEYPPKLVDVDEILGKKVVEFCYHALEQMKIRGVSEAEVLAVLRSPSQTGLPTQPGRERARKFKKPTKAIDVVYELRPEKVVIVTAFPKTFSRHSSPWNEIST